MSAKLQKRFLDRKQSYFKYQVGDLVLIKCHYLSSALNSNIKKFFLLFTGPFKIKDLCNNNTACNVDPQNNQDIGIENFENLKPYHSLQVNNCI